MGQARIKELTKLRDDTIALLSTLTDEEIAELDRRMRFTSKPDGFSTSSMGAPGSGKGGHADPTYSQAIANVSGYDEDKGDPQGKAFKQIVNALRTANKNAATIVNAIALIRHVQNSDETGAHLTPGQGECVVCEKWCRGTANDRLKSRRCPRCHQAWMRWKKVPGNTDHLSFEREHRMALAIRASRLEEK